MITSFLQSGGSTLDEGAPLAGNNLFVMNEDNDNSAQALLQEDAEAPGDQDFLTKGAPQPDAYDSQSGGILDMVDKLGDKFTEERTALENQESNPKHQYDMRTQ